MKYHNGFAVFSGILPRWISGKFEYSPVKDGRLYFLTLDYLHIEERPYTVTDSKEIEGWQINAEHAVFGASYIGIEANVWKLDWRNSRQRYMRRVVWFSVDDNPAPHFPHYLPESYRGWNKARRVDLLLTIVYDKNSLTGADDLEYFSKNFLGRFLGEVITPIVPIAYAILDKVHMIERDGFTIFMRLPIVHMEPDGMFFMSEIILPVSKIKSHVTNKIQGGELTPIGSWKRNLRAGRMKAVVNELLEKYGY